MENCHGGDKMISFDFDYYRPNTIEEALAAYKKVTEQGKSALYLSGGTEIISMARVNQIKFDAVIDIKMIPECNIFEHKTGSLEIGSAVSLTKICDFGSFPLLVSVCRRIAEHTARNMITLGGNIFGKILYKEALLPLFLTDCVGTVAGENGTITKSIIQIFDKKPLLQNGEFLVKVSISESFMDLPYFHIKKTKQEKIDYPLVTVASLKTDEEIRFAFSGLCSYPFKICGGLSQNADDVMGQLPAPVISDIIGSAEYRQFITTNVVNDIFKQYGGMY